MSLPRLTRNQLWLLGMAREGKLYQLVGGALTRHSLVVDLWSGIRGRGDRIVTEQAFKLRDRGVIELEERVEDGRRLWRPTAAGAKLLARGDARRERKANLAAGVEQG